MWKEQKWEEGMKSIHPQLTLRLNSTLAHDVYMPKVGKTGRQAVSEREKERDSRKKKEMPQWLQGLYILKRMTVH